MVFYDNVFDMFISIDRDRIWMKRSVLWVRLGGIAVLVIGIFMIVASWHSDPLNLDMSDRTSEIVLRAGFGIMLLGLFAVFLFSEAAFPKELAISFARTQDENNSRLIASHNLKGKGIYMPPGGRLVSDRVFVPVEDRDLPLPAPSDQSVINTGDLGPALGMFFVPPGKGAADSVEAMTGKHFSDDDPEDAEQALERLTKGTGAIQRIALRRHGNDISLEIRHRAMEDHCSSAFKTFPRLHPSIGCTACSIPLTALARIEGAPLVIKSVAIEGRFVRYELRRIG
jgi:hypothetical protein